MTPLLRNAFAALVALAFAAFALTPAAATSLDRFSDFLKGTQSARGGFTQQIRDRGGRVVQESRGTLAFQRPGRFRWVYEKPYPQVIVGDGRKVWIYDEDLNQVTVKRLDRALGSTPAALLAGSNDVAKAFDLSDAGRKDGLEWVEARPKDKEASFERIRIGFGASGLAAMELSDSFGQTTLLRFQSLQRNPKLDASQFRFSPPKGADVIGDTK
ncbi:MAG TPA: outer membrane lipoprotein chaperone LolA [Burkholderiales bacterium]|nr:outer membrane lipoprotein chaperone LolA [Burkholderiales bacterium]